LVTRASADAISCCSAAEGEHTLSTFTLTWGCAGCCAIASEPKPRQITNACRFRITKGFYQALDLDWGR
jgi:hypothetical protein